MVCDALMVTVLRGSIAVTDKQVMCKFIVVCKLALCKCGVSVGTLRCGALRCGALAKSSRGRQRMSLVRGGYFAISHNPRAEGPPIRHPGTRLVPVVSGLLP